MREKSLATRPEDMTKGIVGNDEISKRIITAGSRYKRIGHVYVQRHSNKKK